jgi:hypothetical protein
VTTAHPLIGRIDDSVGDRELGGCTVSASAACVSACGMADMARQFQ